MKNTRLAGHGLRYEGHPRFCVHGVENGGRWGVKPPCCPVWSQPLDGHAKCSCGVVSPAFDGRRSAGRAKKWHAAHKDEIRAAAAEGAS